MYEADGVADAPAAPQAFGELADAAEAEADVGVFVVIGAGFFRHGSVVRNVRLLLKWQRFRLFTTVHKRASLSP